MNREKQLERALKRLVIYIRENNVCDVVHMGAPGGTWLEKSGQWITLLDQAEDALKKDADQ
jgi:hypothetical protein